MKWFLVVLASLVLVLSVGCQLTGPKRALYVGLCKAQCPIAKSLALRGCAELDAETEPVLSEACVAEADAVAEACPGACEAIFPEPTE